MPGGRSTRCQRLAPDEVEGVEGPSLHVLLLEVPALLPC